MLSGVIEAPELTSRVIRTAHGGIDPAFTGSPQFVHEGLSARLGVPAWSRLAGHTLVTTIEEDDRRTRFFLRKR